MGEVGALFIGVYADVAKARKGLADVTEDVKKTGKAVQKTAGVWDGLLGQLAKIGLAAQGIEILSRSVAKLASIPISLGQVAEDDLRSQRQLGYYMDQLAGQSGTATAGVEALVGELSALTGLQQSDLRIGFMDLLRQYGSVDVASQRLRTATDLMATGYGDLRQSIQGVESAFDSVALRRGFATFTGAAQRESTEATSIFRKFQLAFTELQQEIGKTLLPILTGLAKGLTEAVKGITNAWKIFADDMTGPKITSMSDLWKTVFGTEMPAALKAVTDGIEALWKRTTKFIEDLGSAKTKEDVRTAIEAYVKNVKEIFTEQRTKLGEALDKLGALGLTIKLAATLGAVSAVGLSAGDILAAIIALPSMAFFSAKLLGLTATNPIGLTITAGITLGLFIDQVTAGEAGKNLEEAFRDTKMWVNLLGITAITVGAAIAGAGALVVLTIPVAAILAMAITGVDFNDLIDVGGKLMEWLTDKLGGLAEFANPRGAVPKTPTSTFRLPFDIEQQRIEEANRRRAAEDARRQQEANAQEETARRAAAEAARRAAEEAARRAAGIAASPSATLDDIYAAYARLTGNEISFAYAKDIQARGFTYQQAATGNIFAATGFDSIVAGPKMFMAGEGAEPERVTITPLSKERTQRRQAGGGNTFNVNVGSVDSSQRVDELQRVQARLIRLYS